MDAISLKKGYTFCKKFFTNQKYTELIVCFKLLLSTNFSLHETGKVSTFLEFDDLSFPSSRYVSLKHFQIPSNETGLSTKIWRARNSTFDLYFRRIFYTKNISFQRNDVHVLQIKHIVPHTFVRTPHTAFRAIWHLKDFPINTQKNRDLITNRGTRRGAGSERSCSHLPGTRWNFHDSRYHVLLAVNASEHRRNVSPCGGRGSSSWRLASWLPFSEQRVGKV